MNEPESKRGRPFGYVILFFFSLVFFVYLTFPYGVLKETLTTNISQSTGLVIRMKDFGPSLPLGFAAGEVSVSGGGSGDKSFGMETASLHVSLLPLLWGTLTAGLELESKNDGWLELELDFSLIDMIFDSVFLPGQVFLQAEEFDIGGLASFFIAREGTKPGANPMVSGLLTKIDLRGHLDGGVEIDLDVDDPTRSAGNVNLLLKKAVLKVNDPSLNLPEQRFKKALLRASMQSGSLKVDKKSGFHTEDLKIDVSGNIQLRQKIERSTLNLLLNLKLFKTLKEQFGFMVDMSGGKDGGVAYQMRGTLGRPRVSAR